MHRLSSFKTRLLSGLTIAAIFCSQPLFAQHSIGKALIPDEVGIQYSGSIGYMSLGLGYHLLKEKTTLSFHYGYVPEQKGGELHIAAVKFQYKPITIHISDKVIFHPINPTVFLSYTFGRQFGLKFDRDQYAKGYYFWSPALREHLAFSSEFKLMGDKSSKIKSISLYTEANTNDLYMISWFENRTTTPINDIFHLGFGVRMNF